MKDPNVLAAKLLAMATSIAQVYGFNPDKYTHNLEEASFPEAIKNFIHPTIALDIQSGNTYRCIYCNLDWNEFSLISDTSQEIVDKLYGRFPIRASFTEAIDDNKSYTLEIRIDPYTEE